MGPHPFHLPDRLFRCFQPRQPDAAQRNQVQPRRFEAQVLGTVLPEQGAGASPRQRQPHVGADLFGSRLPFVVDAARVHPGVDLLVPPAAAGPHTARPVGGETGLGEAVGVVAAEKVVAAGGEPPGIELPGADLVPDSGEIRAVAPDFMPVVQAADLLHLPPHLVPQVLVLKLVPQHHLHDGRIGPGRLHVVPIPIAPVQFPVQLIQAEAPPQPIAVSRDGVFAIAALGEPVVGGRRRHPVPDAPHDQVRRVLVTAHHRSEKGPAVFPPLGMVVAVPLPALRSGVAGPGNRDHSLARHHTHIGMTAPHPLGRGAMGGQRHVEPDQEIVLLGQFEEPVEIVQFVLSGLRLHPVPIGERPNDAQAGPPDVGEVLVPEFLRRHGSPVVLDTEHELLGQPGTLFPNRRRGDGGPGPGGHGST